MHIGIPSGSWESKASDSEKIWPMLQCNPFPRSYETAPRNHGGFQLSSTSWDRSKKKSTSSPPCEGTLPTKTHLNLHVYIYIHTYSVFLCVYIYIYSVYIYIIIYCKYVYTYMYIHCVYIYQYIISVYKTLLFCSWRTTKIGPAKWQCFWWPNRSRGPKIEFPAGCTPNA